MGLLFLQPFVKVFGAGGGRGLEWGWGGDGGEGGAWGGWVGVRGEGEETSIVINLKDFFFFFFLFFF